MIVSTTFFLTIASGGNVSQWNFNSILEVKEFLKHVDSWTGLTIRVYKKVATLNTSTHVVTVTPTELTEW